VINTQVADKQLVVVRDVATYVTVCRNQSQIVHMDQSTAPPTDGLLLGSFQASTDAKCLGASVTLLPDDSLGTLSADAADFLWIKSK
jgi:hypothetical protein